MYINEQAQTKQDNVQLVEKFREMLIKIKKFVQIINI